MELEKEHRIESKIAEILDEIKDPDDVKQTEKVDDKSIRQEFINDRKPPAMPAVDEAYSKFCPNEFSGAVHFKIYVKLTCLLCWSVRSRSKIYIFSLG
jgi:hypothetical protein